MRLYGVVDDLPNIYNPDGQHSPIYMGTTRVVFRGQCGSIGIEVTAELPSDKINELLEIYVPTAKMMEALASGDKIKAVNLVLDAIKSRLHDIPTKEATALSDEEDEDIGDIAI